MTIPVWVWLRPNRLIKCKEYTHIYTAGSFARLPNDVVPRVEQGTRDEREETVTVAGTGAGTGTRKSAGMSTRAGMEARTGARIIEGGGKREPKNLRNGNRGGSEDARGGATPTSNQQP